MAVLENIQKTLWAIVTRGGRYGGCAECSRLLVGNPFSRAYLERAKLLVEFLRSSEWRESFATCENVFSSPGHARVRGRIANTPGHRLMRHPQTRLCPAGRPFSCAYKKKKQYLRKMFTTSITVVRIPVESIDYHTRRTHTTVSWCVMWLRGSREKRVPYGLQNMFHRLLSSSTFEKFL